MIPIEKNTGGGEIDGPGKRGGVLWKEDQNDGPETSVTISAIAGGRVLGFAQMVTGGHELVEANPGLIELKELRVSRAFQGKGVGSDLIEYAKAFARTRRKKIILQPLSFADLESEHAGSAFLYKKLREMYIRHGFRALSFWEIDTYTIAVEDRYLTEQLWLNGFDPAVSALTSTRRQSISPENRESLSGISRTDKLRLLKGIFTVRHGSDRLIMAHREEQRRKIQKHLIQL